MASFANFRCSRRTASVLSDATDRNPAHVVNALDDVRRGEAVIILTTEGAYALRQTRSGRLVVRRMEDEGSS